MQKSFRISFLEEPFSRKYFWGTTTDSKNSINNKTKTYQQTGDVMIWRNFNQISFSFPFKQFFGQKVTLAAIKHLICSYIYFFLKTHDYPPHFPFLILNTITINSIKRAKNILAVYELLIININENLFTWRTFSEIQTAVFCIIRIIRCPIHSWLMDVWFIHNVFQLRQNGLLHHSIYFHNNYIINIVSLLLTYPFYYFSVK